MTQKKKLLNYDTTKLFYNKYLYSLSIFNELTPIFRNKNFKFACTVLDGLQANFESGQPLARNINNYTQPIQIGHFIDARTIYNELTRYKKPYIVRCENRHLNVYCNDLSLLERLSKKCKNAISLHQPAKEHLDFIKNNTNTIIVKDDTYKFKVTFGNNLVPDTLSPWLKVNRDKVKVSDMFINDIDRDMRYVNGRYVYITNEKVLMLFKILAGDCIQRIDKLVCVTNIDK
tara:strand:+ start:3825 stop:4517 length:693 start_codon:yes stop_codon:yes gene_type:complete